MVGCVLSQLKPSELYILSCGKGLGYAKVMCFSKYAKVLFFSRYAKVMRFNKYANVMCVSKYAKVYALVGMLR